MNQSTNIKRPSLSPFDLPGIQEQIGACLRPKDLVACSLVSREWYEAFAPFLWWLALEDSDKPLIYLHAQHKISQPLPKGGTRVEDPTFRLEDRFLQVVDQLVQKIEQSRSQAIHQRQRTILSCRSLFSFLLLGWMCHNTRVIEYKYEHPISFAEVHPDDVCRQQQVPEMYKLDNAYGTGQERPDRIVEVIERTRQLEKLYLNDQHLVRRGAFYRWKSVHQPLNTTKKVGTPVKESTTLPSSLFVPHWPKLQSLELQNCLVDMDFIKVLMMNSPRLRRLWLSKIDIKYSSVNRRTNGLASSHRNTVLFDFSQNAVAPPPIQELAVIMGDDLAGQQIMSFAAQLPVLERFRFVGEIERPLYLPGTNNFPTLKRLELIMQSEDSRMENTIMAGVVRAMNCIEELPLYTISISSGLLRDIRQHSRTLTMLRFQSCSVASDLKDIHLHQIFRSCYVLKSLVCTYLPASPNVTLACDPCIFDQQIWACSGLETLRVAPDCVLRGMGYDSLEAQAAFFQQLAMLPYLKELGFARGVGSRSFYLEETLHLLIQSVPNLEVLDVASTELENNANFKPDHAELICRGLPNLKALRGLYHIDCREFVNYIRQHRPEVDLAY